ELVPTERPDNPLGDLTRRELEVLTLLAEGRTDRGIAETLFLSTKTVEAHVRSIFRKLALPAEPTENRRVHAVLAFLRTNARAATPSRSCPHPVRMTDAELSRTTVSHRERPRRGGRRRVGRARSRCARGRRRQRCAGAAAGARREGDAGQHGAPLLRGRP